MNDWGSFDGHAALFWLRPQRSVAQADYYPLKVGVFCALWFVAVLNCLL